MDRTVENNSLALIRRLAKGYLTPYKSKLIFAISCMVFVAAITALTTYMVKPLINGLISPDAESNIYFVPAVILVLYFAKGIFGYFQSFIMEVIGQSVVADLQKDLYEHTINQDLIFFQKHNTSDLSARFLFDLHQLKKALSQTILGVLRDVVTVVGLVTVMFIQDWQLALIAFTAFPLAMIPIIRFGRKVRRYSVGTQEEMGGFSTILKESFMHNRQVKTYTMEPYEMDRAAQSIDRVLYYMIKSARVRALTSPIMEMIGGVIIATVMVYGTIQVRAGETDPGTFLSFLTAAMTIYRPLKGIANINNVLQEGLAAADRTFQLMDTLPTTKDAATTTLAPKKGSITFEDISLQYPDGTQAIENLDLTIPAGKTVALVGSSGAGKSTILNLIPRFYDPTQGRILIDGTPIQDVSLTSLRQHIGLVTQESAIFDDSVFNNIAYGNPSGIAAATKEDVIKAAKAAEAHHFIEALEKGYETIVGEAGFKLSGGQKQRIAIARAMLKNAPILLLDEATSSLDTESEQKVQHALKKLMKGRTSLVVAHRLSTIIDADCIYVLEGGAIIESGTHKQLIAKGKRYASLYNAQSTGVL